MIGVVSMMTNVDFGLLEEREKHPIIIERKLVIEPVTKASRRYNDRSSSSSQTRTFLHCVRAK